MNKVHGGTPKGTQSLCSTCRMCQVTRGINLQTMMYCRQMGKLISFPVETCTMYDDTRMPSMYQMEQIAWEVKTRNRGRMGFATGDDVEVTIEPPRRDYPSQPATTTMEDERGTR